MVFLISYDIPTTSASDEASMLEMLKTMGAVRCLYSEWLYEGSETAQQIASFLLGGLSADDRLMVMQVGDDVAWSNLKNPTASADLINRS